MDATTAIKATVCAAAMIITLHSCTGSTGTQQAQEPEPELQFQGYDLHTNAGTALQNLEIFLQSIPTTTTTMVASQQPMIAASGNIWDQLAQCETGGNWSANTGNGFGGGVQFAHQPSWSTWNAYGGTQFTTHPWEATREQQIEIAERVLQSAGWGAWPGCARKLGLR